MPKVFNITGNCIPRLHYMVNLDSRLQAIRKLVDAGQYITINRGRQYGKTTTLKALTRAFSDNYYVLDMDFQTAMSGAAFQTEESFVRAFAESFCFLFEMTDTNGELDELLAAMQKAASEKIKLVQLFRFLAKICKAADKPIVLLIDEVDSASNNQVFLDFLAQLRGYYLNRDTVPTFHSVILAGVHDIRNLQLKIRPDAEHKLNSPWNIATALEIDMSFSPEDIAGMLRDYETDHSTGMDIAAISQMIYDYTSGYPVLVSMICKFIDEKANAAWTGESIAEAVKYIINEPTPLFESLINKIEDYPELREMLYAMLFSGKEYSFNVDNPTFRLMHMYGFVTKRGGKAVIANRIFETRLYNYFLSVEKTSSPIAQDGALHKSEFIENGKLNIERVLERFVAVYTDLYGDQPEAFLEDAGRRLFLLFLRPIINGTANYYVEAQTRNQCRTDLIIDYLGEQYIIEMKIWRGQEYNERGEQQLAEYLDYYHIDKGYLLSFNFNQSKQIGTKTVQVGDKTVFEAVV